MAIRESVITEVADAGAEYAFEHFRTTFDIETKSSKTDLVTEVDRSTQRRIVETIREQFPDDVIVGEENEQQTTVPETGYAWIIDPIDGTQNYVFGMNEWVTSVALVESGSSIAAVNSVPAVDDVYVATRSELTRNGRSISVSDTTDPETFRVALMLRVHTEESDTIGRFTRLTVDRFGELRRTGSAQLTLSMVASGALDATVGFGSSPNAWDTVAGVYHVRQAGGTVTDLHGNDWAVGGPGIVASNGHAHEELLSAAQTAME